MTFGVTLEGFVPMLLEDLKAALEDDFRAAFGQNVRVDAESVNGQLIGIVAERMADVWAVNDKVYAAAYIGGATGSALDDLVALAAVTRLPATYSVVPLELGGDDATAIPAGSQVRDPATQQIWTTTDDATISAGVAAVNARPTVTGPIQALSTPPTITEVVTTISGWSSVTNTADAVPGRDVESDAALRLRYSILMRAGGGSAADAIRAAVMRVTGVTECSVIENMDWLPDADGMPPKSFEVVVRGGEGGNEQAIGDAIWATKPAGIQSRGTTSQTVTDAAGNTQTVWFTRPTEVEVYFAVDYQVMPAPPSDIEVQIRDALLAHGLTLQTGDDVIPWQFEQVIETSKLRDLNLRVGLASDPPDDTPLDINKRSLAVFDSSRILFNRTN